MTQYPTWALALALCVASLTTAASQTASDVETLDPKDAPRLVAARMTCKGASGPVTRRAFAGGFVFAQACAGGADLKYNHVFANDKDGGGARLLQFHRPEGRRVSALGDVVYGPNGTEIAGTVGRLSRRICRAEGRWRMEGKTPSPTLVYWRQTRDCDGKTGWLVIVNRKG